MNGRGRRIRDTVPRKALLLVILHTCVVSVYVKLWQKAGSFKLPTFYVWFNGKLSESLV